MKDVFFWSVFFAAYKSVAHLKFLRRTRNVNLDITHHYISNCTTSCRALSAYASCFLTMRKHHWTPDPWFALPEVLLDLIIWLNSATRSWMLSSINPGTHYTYVVWLVCKLDWFRSIAFTMKVGAGNPNPLISSQIR